MHTKTPHQYLFNTQVFNYQRNPDQITYLPNANILVLPGSFVRLIAPQSQMQIQKNNTVGSLLFLKFYVQVRIIFFF